MTPHWQKSSYCSEGDSCIHIATTPTTPRAIHLTESGDPTGAVLTTTPTAFRTLLTTLKTDTPPPKTTTPKSKSPSTKPPIPPTPPSTSARPPPPKPSSPPTDANGTPSSWAYGQASSTTSPKRARRWRHAERDEYAWPRPADP